MEVEHELEVEELIAAQENVSVAASDGRANVIQNRTPANRDVPSDQTLRLVREFVRKAVAEPDRHRVLGETTPPLDTIR